MSAPVRRPTSRTPRRWRRKKNFPLRVAEVRAKLQGELSTPVKRPARIPWILGIGAVLIIGPLVRHHGERYQHHPIRGDEKPPQTNGSTKPSRAAASSEHSEGQVAASSGTAPGEDVQTP